MYLLKMVGIIVFLVILSSHRISAEQKLYNKEAVENAKLARDQLSLQDQTRAKMDDEQRRLLQKKLAKLEEGKAPSAAIIEGELSAFLIDKINLKGCTLLSFSIQDTLIQKYNHRTLNINEINALLGELTQVYFNQGYITTRVYLPKQNLKAGILEIQVVEGRLDKIIVDDRESAAAIGIAFPGMVGNVLNIRDLEQGLEQLNRLPSNHAIMSLMPSETLSGGTIVQIKNRVTQKTSGAVRFDTFQTKALDIYPTSLDVVADNIGSLNDQWNLTYFQKFKAPNQFQNSYRIAATIGLGYFTPRVAYSGFNYTTLIDSNGQSILSSGTNKAFQMGLDVMIRRDGCSKTTLSFDYTTKENDNFIEDSIIGVNSNAFRQGSIGIQTLVFLESSIFSGNLVYTIGTKTSKLTDDEKPLYSDLEGSKAFTKLTGELNFTTPVTWFGVAVQSSLKVSGQYGFSSLYSTEGFSLGDYASIRGFNASFLGDSGLSSTAKITYPFSWAGRGWSLYHALDAGFAWQKGALRLSSGAGRAYLASLVSGITYRDADWGLEGTVAKAVMGTQVPIENVQFYLSIVRFF